MRLFFFSAGAKRGNCIISPVPGRGNNRESLEKIAALECAPLFLFRITTSLFLISSKRRETRGRKAHFRFLNYSLSLIKTFRRAFLRENFAEVVFIARNATRRLSDFESSQNAIYLRRADRVRKKVSIFGRAAPMTRYVTGIIGFGEQGIAVFHGRTRAISSFFHAYVISQPWFVSGQRDNVNARWDTQFFGVFAKRAAFFNWNFEKKVSAERAWRQSSTREVIWKKLNEASLCENSAHARLLFSRCKAVFFLFL